MHPLWAELASRIANTISIVYLTGATLLFAIGQIFDFVISPHICNHTSGRVNGALFETLFTLLAVVVVWLFWNSITEDDWAPTITSTVPPDNFLAINTLSDNFRTTNVRWRNALELIAVQNLIWLNNSPYTRYFGCFVFFSFSRSSYHSTQIGYLSPCRRELQTLKITFAT